MSEIRVSTPDISVVLEWENALWADQQLGAQVLGALRQQFESLERPAELILQFNHAQVDPDSMRSLVDTWLGSDLALDVRLEPADDLRYYELKNAGARLARGEILVFADCDSTPAAGWLLAMTEPFFENPDIQVLAGHTHIFHDSLYQKAFALEPSLSAFDILPPTEDPAMNARLARAPKSGLEGDEALWDFWYLMCAVRLQQSAQQMLDFGRISEIEAYLIDCNLAPETEA